MASKPSPGAKPDAERGHEVLGIVRAAQPRVGHRQHRRSAEMDDPVAQIEIPARDMHCAESDLLRRQVRAARSRKLTIAQSSHGLVFEDAQLRLAVLVERGIAIEVIGAQSPARPRWMRAEAADCFELKRAELERHHIELRALFDLGRKGRADVASGDGFHTAAIQHALDELRRGGLSVRARNADDRALAHLVSELEFADHRDALTQEILHQRRPRIDPRTEHCEVE